MLTVGSEEIWLSDTNIRVSAFILLGLFLLGASIFLVQLLWHHHSVTRVSVVLTIS